MIPRAHSRILRAYESSGIHTRWERDMHRHTKDEHERWTVNEWTNNEWTKKNTTTSEFDAQRNAQTKINAESEQWAHREYEDENEDEDKEEEVEAGTREG